MVTTKIMHFQKVPTVPCGCIFHGKCLIFLYEFIVPHYSSFLYTHWSSHGNMYIQKCQELEVNPNPHALPKPDTEHTKGLSKQGSLNSFIEATPNIKWSRQGLLEHIIDSIISDNQVSLVHYHLSSRFLIYPSVFPA